MKTTAILPFFLAAAAQARISSDNNNRQAVFDEVVAKRPVTFSIREDVSSSLPAETVELGLAVRACESSSKHAFSTVERYMLDLQLMAKDTRSNYTVTSSSSLGGRNDDDWEDTYCSRRGCSTPGFKDKDGIAEDEQCVSSSVTIRVDDMENLQPLADKLSTMPKDVKIEDIDWKLTEASKKVLKAKVRREAAVKAQEARNDYASVFGVSSVSLVEFDEEYSYDSVVEPNKYGKRRYWRDDPIEAKGISIPNIQMMTEVRCKFST